MNPLICPADPREAAPSEFGLEAARKHLQPASDVLSGHRLGNSGQSIVRQGRCLQSIPSLSFGSPQPNLTRSGYAGRRLPVQGGSALNPFLVEGARYPVGSWSLLKREAGPAVATVSGITPEAGK